MTTAPERRRAFGAIEDDLSLVQAAAGVLHMAFNDLSEVHGQGMSALAQSLWFTAVGIEAACERIRETLDPEEPDNDPACACHREAAS